VGILAGEEVVARNMDGLPLGGIVVVDLDLEEAGG
jgi:hypothetical protein